MDRLGPPTWFRSWQRGPALLVLALLLAGLIAACWPSANASPGPKLRATSGQQGDADLYRTIIARVAGGQGYYQAAADELRRGPYPLKPFLTFRLPTLALIYARLGEQMMIVLQVMLAIAIVMAWWRRLGADAPLWIRAVSLFGLSAGLGGLVEPVTGVFHESWAALLMALSIGLRRPGHAAAAVVVGGAALLVRETALPMVLMMGGLAIVGRCWREAAGWVATLVAFGAYLAWHAAQVAAVVRPGDPPSPGWDALLGPGFALKAMAATNGVTVLPQSIASAILILSLFGWASVATGWALRAAMLSLGYALMLALFARADTFYWALLASPLAVMGVAFVPAALRDLAGALDLMPRRVALSAA